MSSLLSVGGIGAFAASQATEPVATNDHLRNLRELGDHARWTLSTCKPGFGVENLRDNSPDTYWQSDGPQPHLVNIQFYRKTLVSELRMYVDVKQDESYTPCKVSIRAGSTLHDLQEVKLLELEDETGWIPIDMTDHGRPMKTHFVQLAVLSNQQNGRDTHIRLLKIFGPLQSTLPAQPQFDSVELAMYSGLR